MVRRSFGTPNPGSAKERTMQHAIAVGKVTAGDCRPSLRSVRRALEALEEKFIEAGCLAVEVRRGDEVDPTMWDRPGDGFLFYPIRLEVEPLGDPPQAQYLQEVGALLTALRAEGWAAVAACDFEDQLPEA